MTPGARVAAAIEILDAWLGGAPAEQALTGWARGNRFAGSKDRAAIRDHVFDAIRCRRSFAALGGAETGRGLMIGAARAAGRDPAEVFTGEGYAPPALAAEEAAPTEDILRRAERLDVPDWLLPRLEASLGAGTDAVLDLMRRRAPVFLRANLRRTTREAAQDALAEDGVSAAPHPLASTALEVTSGARRIRQSRAFLDGLVELQDAASQALVDALPIPGDAGSVLDFCAGGGGKALAIAARTRAAVFAHDAFPGRMADIPARADRAGVQIAVLAPGALADRAPFDLVLADAPCSGSGAWRRQPAAKWELAPERLDELSETQSAILEQAAVLVAPEGTLAYATCSVLREENEQVVERFLSGAEGWHLAFDRRFSPLEGGDGFYLALLRRV